MLAGSVVLEPLRTLEFTASASAAEALQTLLKELGKGPTHALVSRVEKTEMEPVEGEGEFEVRR